MKPLPLSALGLALILSCGGAPGPPPAAVATIAIAAPPPALAPQPDTSPLPMPRSFLLALHVKDLGSVLHRAADLLRPQAPVLDGLAPDDMAAVYLGSELASVVDLAKPIDVAVVRPDAIVVSLAVTSLDDARSELAGDYALVPEKDGAIDLRRMRGKDPRRCELRAAAGVAPYRLLCATTVDARKEAAPWLVRTAARDESDADVRVVFDLGAQVMEEMKTRDAPADAAAAAGEAVARAFAADLDVGALEARLDAEGVVVSATQTFRHQRSPFTRLVASMGRDAVPAPEAFWRLPRDSYGALYTRGASAEQLGPLRLLGTEMFRKSFKEGGFWPEDAEADVKALFSVFLTGGPFVAAYGFDRKAALEALSSATASRPAPAASLHGWWLFGVEEAASRWTGVMRELMARDAVIRKKGRNPNAPAPKGPPPSRSRQIEAPLGDAKLPAGSAHFLWIEESSGGASGASRARRVTSTTHVYVVAAGTRTWIAVGQSEALVLAKVRGALGKARDASLDARADLALLRGPSTLGGFLSLGLFDLLDVQDDDASRAAARATLERMAAPANDVAVPFLFPAALGDAPAVEARARVTKAVMQDVVSRVH